MNFETLLQHANTAEWTKNIVQRLQPYPYLADTIIVILALAIGAAR